MNQPIKRPERLTIVVCDWIKRHVERGDNKVLVMGGNKYSVVDFQFNEWHFPHATPLFVIEFISFFPDRILEVIKITCQECADEIDTELDCEIIDAGGIPPNDTR